MDAFFIEAMDKMHSVILREVREDKFTLRRPSKEMYDFKRWFENFAKKIQWSKTGCPACLQIQTLNEPPATQITCPSCNGSGQLCDCMGYWDTCNKCNGNKTITLSSKEAYFHQ